MEIVDDTEKPRQLMAWKLAREGNDEAAQVRALLANAAWFEPKFRTAIEALVVAVNTADSVTDLCEAFGLEESKFLLKLRSKMKLESHSNLLVRGRFGESTFSV